MQHRNISELVGHYTGLSRKVLDYSLTMKRLVDAAKQPGFSEASWAPLAELVAVDEFERVGTFLEVMRWPEYVAFLTPWARSSGWEWRFVRITEASNVVVLELEEHNELGDHRNVLNSATAYEFNTTGKLRHLRVYLQMKLANLEALHVQK